MRDGYDTLQRGFYTIMAAQFFSSLADNALLVAALELLRASNAPAWHATALVPMFALFYVLLAPGLGAFADFLPKGRVMFISNSIKIAGCLVMLFGGHPLIAYAIVGLGAAAYSPAKYGILTEMLPPSMLVKANGWIEGLTIASIILGIVMGGQLIGATLSSQLLSFDFPGIETSVDSAPEAAIAFLILIYIIAAIFNLYIPRTNAPLQKFPSSFGLLMADFWRCNTKLWKDKLGQISLSTTTLFWGVSANMRVIVFTWAAAALSYSTSEASLLAGVVAFGTAFGAVIASTRMRLDDAPKVISLGVAMGVFMILLVFVRNLWVAIPFLIFLGVVGGFLVVPMNALLQHRGHTLMGAGRSLAVQNFNEQLCILAISGLYVGMTRANVSVYVSIALLGTIVGGTMWGILRWHKSNLARHPAEMEHLLMIARSEKH
jgi:MFS transporter, LPLT family, lysophospholipid transporter